MKHLQLLDFYSLYYISSLNGSEHKSFNLMKSCFRLILYSMKGKTIWKELIATRLHQNFIHPIQLSTSLVLQFSNILEYNILTFMYYHGNELFSFEHMSPICFQHLYTFDIYHHFAMIQVRFLIFYVHHRAFDHGHSF